MQNESWASRLPVDFKGQPKRFQWKPLKPPRISHWSSSNSHYGATCYYSLQVACFPLVSLTWQIEWQFRIFQFCRPSSVVYKECAHIRPKWNWERESDVTGSDNQCDLLISNLAQFVDHHFLLGLGWAQPIAYHFLLHHSLSVLSCRPDLYTLFAYRWWRSTDKTVMNIITFQLAMSSYRLSGLL